MKSSSPGQDALKRAAAARVVAEIEDGMILGLGSGSTAAIAVELLAKRIAEGLRVVGIPTSERTAALARRLGVPLTHFAEHRRIDLVFDGADQVELPGLNLVKGLGGALLREKIVAAASDKMIVVVDETKLVARLGGAVPVPVEIAAFGWQATVEHLAALGLTPRLRTTGDKVFMTDGGNLIADCAVAEIADPAALQARIASVVGVMESGLFVGLATAVVVGRLDGAELIQKAKTA